MEILTKVIYEFWGTFSDMAPYLLFGFFIAGLLSVFVSPEKVERHLGGNGIWPVLKASVFGVPLPLCSCGVIPVATSLRRHGASRGATTAFLLSTPQTGVDSIMVTFSLLGPVFAIFRPLAAFVTGTVGGVLVNIFGHSVQDDVGHGHEETTCKDECCSTEVQGNAWFRALRYGFITLPRDIARPMIAGVAIAGLISAFTPPDFIRHTIGAGIGAMLVMMAMGIPIYVCATASVPIAAAMIAKGASPGAALVFLMTGPATNAAAIVTLWKVLGRRTTLVYLGTVVVCALGSGLLLDYAFTVTGVEPAYSGHRMLPEWARTIAALVLLGVLLAGVLGRRKTADKGVIVPEGGTATNLAVSGMTCSQCANAVRLAALAVPGVTSVQVELARGRAVVAGRDYDMASVAAAVEELGYSAAVVPE
jgi:uncharacterized membrane protein YraQ (UPF0718 family)/copper chaperone CopZ